MSVQQLYLLQKVDTEILKLREESDKINADLLSSPEAERAAATVVAATKVYSELCANQHEAQKESDSLASKIAETDTRLYSGRVTNPKELSDLTEDLRQLRVRQSSSDDELLKIMDKVERMQVRLKQAETDLKVTTDSAQHQSSKNRLRLEAIEATLNTLSIERATAVNLVNASELNIYTQLMSSKDNTAVAEVHVGRCTSCRIMVSSSDSMRAHTGKELVYCSSCGRILLN